jgi:hypothetical protein
MPLKGLDSFNERVEIVVHGLPPLSKSNPCRKAGAEFWKTATRSKSVRGHIVGIRDSRNAIHLRVFGKLLVSTIRRAHSSDAKLLRDLRPGTALLAERVNLANIHDNLRATETVPFGLRVSKPGLHALYDQTSLQFRDRSEDGEDHPARWRGCVERL